LTRALAATALLLVLPYAWTPLYRFPAPAPFAGSQLFNPYAALRGTWQRANLHAHGRAWSGLTNGRQPDAEVARRYLELGYDVPGISNYQQIAAPAGVATIPIYEHGYNIGKHHQLAIGARDVAWFDVPLWQSTSQQQFVIDRVRGTTELVALAHPNSRYAYSTENLRQLTGYQLLEVANGPFTAEEAWDTVLSAGRVVWGLANDDTHDLEDPRRTAAAWTMIDAGAPTTEELVDALRTGRSYAVVRTGAIESAHVTTLVRVEVRDATVRVTTAGAASTLTFIGQNGVVRKTVSDATEADYTFSDGDTYIRAVIESPQTVLYLNPVIRYDGTTLRAAAATPDLSGTWLLRVAFALGCVALVVLRWRRRSILDVSEPTAVLADAKRKPA
jgi:hypothetical protein